MKVVARLLALVEAAAHRPSILDSARTRRIGVLLAAVVFFGGLSLALAARGAELLREVDFAAWALVLACVPLTVLANSCQFWLTARMLHVPMPPVRAVLVTLLSTAANVLPVPGGSVVRVAALKRVDTTYRQGAVATLLVGGNRIGIGLSFAGCALLALDFERLGAVALVCGLVACGGAGLGLCVSQKAGATLLSALAGAQSAMVFTSTLRLWLGFRALGEPAAALEAVTLTLSSIVAAIVGFAPAGLGVAEVTAAGIAMTIGIPASLAFIVAALNRISGLIVAGLLALFLNVGEWVRAEDYSAGSSERAWD